MELSAVVVMGMLIITGCGSKATNNRNNIFKRNRKSTSITYGSEGSNYQQEV